MVRDIVAEAYQAGAEFGRLIDLAAVTGARYDQLARAEVQDLRGAGDTAAVMMPRSKKGKGEKAIPNYAVPIPAALADALRVAATDRPATDKLLLKPSGEPWSKSDHSRPFRRAARRAGQDPATVTLTAFRHSSIVRQLLAGVPIRLVAVKHDTSVAMIEKTYSAHIGDHADQMMRAVMLDTSRPAASVVPLRA